MMERSDNKGKEGLGRLASSGVFLPGWSWMVLDGPG
jgi:hypothetical protein